MPKKVKFIQLLYVASENGFSAKQFHGKCDHIPNTLTLCLTEFYTKIGGFTPLVWSSNGSYQTDFTGESFIFSLTNKDKFRLSQSKHAIFDNSKYGPAFGDGCDLCIGHNANTNNESYAKINNIYTNSKYTKNECSSWQKFLGNPLPSFKVREW